MPPKRATPASRPSARASGLPARKEEEPGTIGGALRNTYDVLTAQENRSLLKALGFAGVSWRFFELEIFSSRLRDEERQLRRMRRSLDER